MRPAPPPRACLAYPAAAARNRCRRHRTAPSARRSASPRRAWHWRPRAAAAARRGSARRPARAAAARRPARSPAARPPRAAARRRLAAPAAEPLPSLRSSRRAAASRPWRGRSPRAASAGAWCDRGTGGPRVTSELSEDDRTAQPSDASVASKPAAAVAPGLHIVATPIGNLADIGLRALAVLRGADLIACEDTRVTGKLAARYGIATRRIAYNDHNGERVRPLLLERLRGGAAIALVSDAGTPLVSDPGYKLVRAVIAAGLLVTVVPGAAAPLAALALSGLPTDRFLFAGFLPPRAAARRRSLAELAAVPATLVLFESPRRLAATLAE